MLKRSQDLIKETQEQIHNFQHGLVKPISTGIAHLDYHLLGGLTPSTVLGICGLSTHGKTFFLEQINANVVKHEDVVLLQCLWELELFKIVVRDLAKKTKKTVKEVLFQMPDSDTKDKYLEIYERYNSNNMYFQTEPVSTDVFAEDIEGLIRNYPNKKIVVTVDNLENILVTSETQKLTMDKLISVINKLKKTHPFIIFIVLNQLNREVAERTGDPKNHFPREGDIYGSSALFKLCDVLVVKHLPYKLGIEKYGVFSQDRFSYQGVSEFKLTGNKTCQLDSVGVAFYHYLKSRNIEEEYDRQDVFGERIFGKPRVSNFRPLSEVLEKEEDDNEPIW
jgi:KaiC/GvpD/RAD55 family RecA-like ATPase